MIKHMLDDNRPIKMAWSAPPDEVGATVGHTKGVTRMEAYGENGEMAPVPWIAVYKTDANGKEFLWKRPNAAHMAEVEYFE